MPGRKPLRRLQLGKEVTPGTAVTATARMRWNGGMLNDARVVTFPEESVGLFGATDRSYIADITAALSVAETPLTPEQLPYVLAALFGGPVTGTADGAGSTGFKYITTIPTTAAPTNTAYTVEGGDDFEVEKLAYGKCVKLTLKGSAQKVCTQASEWIGNQVTRLGTAFTTTSIVDVNDLIFGNAKLFLDAIGGTIGTTAVANQFLGFEVTLEGMWVPKYTGDGNGAQWNFAVFVDKKVSGKLTMEHDTAVDGSTGIKALLRAQTARLMRIDVTGQSYATPGSGTIFTGGKRGVRIDLPIKFTKVPPLEDMNKNDIVTVEFESRYNGTFGSAGSLTVCNEVSALP